MLPREAISRFGTGSDSSAASSAARPGAITTLAQGVSVSIVASRGMADNTSVLTHLHFVELVCAPVFCAPGSRARMSASRAANCHAASSKVCGSGAGRASSGSSASSMRTMGRLPVSVAQTRRFSCTTRPDSSDRSDPGAGHSTRPYLFSAATMVFHSSACGC